MISTDEVDAWLIDLEPEAPAELVAEPPAQPSTVATVVRGGLVIFTIAILAFLAFAFWFSGLSHARSQVGLQRRFNTELSDLSAPVSGVIAPGTPVASLRIPSAGVHEVVVEGSRSGVLRGGPGHVVGTPLPGQPGNAVIAGRHTMYGGPFKHIGSLKPGARISVMTLLGSEIQRLVASVRLSASLPRAIPPSEPRAGGRD